MLLNLASNSALALTAEKGDTMDILILDLNMPGIPGTRCLRELRKQNAHVPVLIASGYSDNGQVKDAITSFVAGFIGKPFRVTALLAGIRNALNSGVEGM